MGVNLNVPDQCCFTTRFFQVEPFWAQFIKYIINLIKLYLNTRLINKRLIIFNYYYAISSYPVLRTALIGLNFPKARPEELKSRQYRCPCFWQKYQVSTYFRRSKWKTVKFGIGPTGWTYFSRSSFSKNSRYLANFEAWTWVFLFRCLTWGSRAFPWGRPASPAAIARSEPRCAGTLARCSRATWTQLKWDF